MRETSQGPSFVNGRLGNADRTIRYDTIRYDTIRHNTIRYEIRDTRYDMIHSKEKLHQDHAFEQILCMSVSDVRGRRPRRLLFATAT